MKRWLRWLVLGCASALVGACILSPIEDLPSRRGSRGDNNASDPDDLPPSGAGGSLNGPSPPDNGAAGAAGTAATTASAGAPVR